MPGSERKAAAKEVDAVFSTAAVVETRGRAGEGGERRQRATGVRDNRVDGRLGSGDGGSVRTRTRDQLRETATTRPWRQRRTASKEKDAADDAGRGCRERRRRGRQETGKEGAGGSASAASRRKQRRRKRPRSMAATASWEAGTGGLMKTETKPTATEKSEGREDPHVVGGGKDEEGERDSGGGEVCRGSGDSITEEKGGGVCGDGREGREGDGRR